MGKEWRMRTVWPRWVAGLFVGLAAAGVLLSGCGGDSPEPKPLPKDSKSSASASPSATPPVMPAAAKKKTKAGAEAFVEHYIEVVNYAGESGSTRELQTLSLNTCVKCKALADGIAKVYSDGGRIVGGGWKVDGFKHYGFDRNHYFLDAIIDSAPQQMIKAKGAPAERFPGAQNRVRAFVLQPAAGGWKVSELDPSA